MDRDPEATARALLAGGSSAPPSDAVAADDEATLDVEGVALEAAADEAFTALQANDRAGFKAALRSALQALIAEA